jgi:hypothetical protein
MGSEDEIFEYIAHFFDVNDSDHPSVDAAIIKLTMKGSIMIKKTKKRKKIKSK